jgi:Flp pilus assembly protein TadD
LPAEAGGARYDAVPTPAGLARAGQAALDAGDPATAVADFRRWAYLRPDDGLAHLHLGLALEAAGAPAAAARAYAAARSALSRNAGASGDDALGGYKLDEYFRLLDHKQERS